VELPTSRKQNTRAVRCREIPKNDIQPDYHNSVEFYVLWYHRSTNLALP
jgi:hypothetical protein